MNCSKCGTPSQEGFKFCKECGEPIEQVEKKNAAMNNGVTTQRWNLKFIILFMILSIAIVSGGYFAYGYYSGNGDNVGLYPVVNNLGNWGYMNRKGEMVVSPQFAVAERFVKGFAIVGKKNINKQTEWGLIDKNGKIAIDIKYAYIRPIAEDMIAVAVSDGDKTSKWGYVNLKGQFVIAPQYRLAYSFSDGLALVCVSRNKWGFIDKTGKMIINPEFSDQSVGFFEGHKDPESQFVNGLAPIANAEGLWGYIDKTGKFVIKSQYSSARIFNDDLAAVSIYSNFQNRKWGYIDKTGKMVIQPEFMVADRFSEDKAVVAIAGSAEANRTDWKYGVINKKGEFIIQPKWTNFQLTHDPMSSEARLGFFSNGLLTVSSQIARRNTPNKGTWGFVDTKGETVIEQKFLRVSEFRNELAMVTLEDKSVAYIDKTGNIIKPQTTKEEVAAAPLSAPLIEVKGATVESKDSSKKNAGDAPISDTEIIEMPTRQNIIPAMALTIINGQNGAVNLYARPNSNAKVIGTISEAFVFKTSSITNDFYFINNKGWVHRANAKSI